MKEQTANAIDNWVRLITTQVNAVQTDDEQKKLLNQAADDVAECLCSLEELQ